MIVKRTILANLLLVSLSTLFTVALLEIALRWFGHPPPPPEDTLRTYTEFDAELGWRGRAAAHGRYNTSRFSITVALNSGGWRDDEPTLPVGAVTVSSAAGRIESPSPESPLRAQVAVLGDSFTWGYGVERDERFSDRLEAALPGWNVQNYGVCGYGTDQELLVLRHSARRIAPRLVIVEFAIGNDLDNILSARAYNLPKPRFRLENGVLRLDGVPVPRTENWQRAARTGPRDFLTKHLRVYAWVRPRWAGLRPGISRIFRLVHADAGEGVRLRIYEREASQPVLSGWQLAEELLGAIRDDAARTGGRLAVLVVPDRLQVEDRLWEQTVREFHLDPALYDRDLPDRRLREIGNRLGVMIVDPLTEQRRLASQGQTLFITGDPHWNAQGHAVAAEALRTALAPTLLQASDRKHVGHPIRLSDSVHQLGRSSVPVESLRR